MKKSIYTFGICLALGLYSCSGAIDDTVSGLETIADKVADEVAAEPTIVGDWGLSDFDMGMEIPAGQEEMFDNMKKEMVANSTMSYKADGTFTQTDKMGGEVKNQTGTYTIDGNVMTTTSSDGAETKVNIASLTDTEVSFTMEERGSTMTMTYARK